MPGYEKKDNPKDKDGFMKCYTCGAKVKYNNSFYNLVKKHLGIRWQDLNDAERMEVGAELRMKGIYPTLNPDGTSHICSENIDKSVVMQGIEMRLDRLEKMFEQIPANIEKLTVMIGNLMANIQKNEILAEIRKNFNLMIQKIEGLDGRIISKLDYYYQSKKKK